MQRKGNLADLFLMFPSQPQGDQKDFYSFIKLSRNEAFGYFLVSLSNGCHGNGNHDKNLNFTFRYVFAILLQYKVSYHQVAEKSIRNQNHQIFNF